MFKMSIKERIIITLVTSVLLLIIYIILAVFLKYIRHDFFPLFITAVLGAASYQSLDGLVYWLRHRK
jgi:hypothetical protein